MPDDDPTSLPALAPPAATLLNALTSGFGRAVSETASDVFGGLLGDRIKEWRVRNLVDTIGRSAEKMRKRGISLAEARSLPNHELYLLFEGIAKTDEPSLQDMWAGLLANAADPSATFEVSPTIPAALNQLGRADAIAFHIIVRMRAWMSEFQRINTETIQLRREQYATMDSTLYHGFRRQQRKAFASSFDKWIAPELSKIEKVTGIVKENLARLDLITVDSALASQLATTNARTKLHQRIDLVRYKSEIEEVSRIVDDLKKESEERAVKDSIFERALLDFPLVTAANGDIATIFSLTSFGKRFASACRVEDDLEKLSIPKLD